MPSGDNLTCLEIYFGRDKFSDTPKREDYLGSDCVIPTFSSF